MRDGRDGGWFDQRDPPDDGGRPLTDAVVSPPGDGETITAGGARLVLKATSDGTDGLLFLSEATMPPGYAGPPLHRHRDLHDMFYVLDGTLSLRSGDETVDASPGTFAYFPPGAAHTFSNATDQPARFLNFNTPAGWERYMRDLGAAFANDEVPSPESIGAIALRYDFELA
jgi:quercetin dioxygenase-like cupin family protein